MSALQLTDASPAGAPEASDPRPGPFISYAREDQDVVRKLHDALLKRGRDAWVDWEIFPSAEWMQEIRSAIDAAPAVVFLISPESIASPICRQELDHALAQNKRLIPVVCRSVDADRVEESLRKLNWIQLLDPDELDRKVEQLIEVMDADLDWVSAHARLLTRARDWEAKGRDRSLLLHGNDLKDSERWLAAIGVDRTPRPTALQIQYVIASRRVETTRQRYILASVGTALVVTAALAVYAVIQSRIADHQRDVALSRLVAAQSLKHSSEPLGQLDLSLLLAVAASQIHPTLEARDSLFGALLETERVRRFVHGSRTLVSLAVSPDGRTIATGDFNGGIVLRDAETLQARATLQHGKGVVESVAFSPDGRTLASAGSGPIMLWDAHSGQERGTLDGGHKYVKRVVWHPDGATLLSGSRNEPLIFVWDAATGTRRSTIPHDRLMSLAVSPDGATIASAADRSGDVRLWDMKSGEERIVLRGHHGPVRAVAFSRDGKLLASAGQDSRIIIWDAASGERRMTLEGQTDRIECVAFSPDGTRLASGSNNRTIVLWDLTTGRPLDLLRGHTNSLMNVAFTPDGKQLLSNAFDGTFIVWNLDAAWRRRLKAHAADVRVVAVSPDGATLASGSDDRTVRLWDLAGGRERAVLKGHRGALRAVAFSPDGRVLASGGEGDRRIILWDVVTGHKLKELRGEGDVTSVAFSPDGKTLASGADATRSVFLWDVATGKRRAELRGHESSVGAVAFSRDGKLLVSGGGEGVLRVWDPATGKEIAEPMGAGGSVATLAFSPAGTTIASSAHFSSALLLSDPYGRREPVALDTRGSHAPTGIAYSPDGKLLAYAAGELRFTIVLWDLERAEPRGALRASATTLSMAYTPDGRQLVTGHSNGEVASWDVDLDGWPRRACEIANRNLTRDEWQAFVGEPLPYRAVCPGLAFPSD
jgi:WD40 repeat protein